MIETKICAECKQAKSLTDFSFRSKEKGHKRAECKLCFSKHTARHYQNNTGKYKKASAESHKRRKDWLNAKKDFPCADCNQKFHPCVMEFDHVQGQKRGSVSNMILRCSLKLVEAEIAKCELVCSNCHKMRELYRRGK